MSEARLCLPAPYKDLERPTRAAGRSHLLEFIEPSPDLGIARAFEKPAPSLIVEARERIQIDWVGDLQGAEASAGPGTDAAEMDPSPKRSEHLHDLGERPRVALSHSHQGDL
jgi:hypothetical protein